MLYLTDVIRCLLAYDGPKDVVLPDGTSADVPLQKIYLVTTTGDFDGVIGMPIIEYHTSDGVMYSDYMVVTFVDAPGDYVAGMYKSVGDLTDSGAAMTMSDIVLNIPVVPTGSSLQHPVTVGTNKAPILPTPVYYRGVEVWTYLFEVTDASAAAFFADTRTETGSEIARQGDSTTATEFGIPVVPFATPDFVSAIPIWHVNQFSHGVVAGENGGGPNPAGMRNVINLDRSDAGYSPLWQILWSTSLPVGYSADEWSNAAHGTMDNGFEFFPAPMYVNCPTIGPVGMDNTMKADMFETSIMLDRADMDGMFMLIGSDPSLIFMADKMIKFMTDTGDMAGNTTTNMMGGYEYPLMAAAIPEGTTMVMVMLEDGTTIRNITVEEMMGDDMDGDMDEDMMGEDMGGDPSGAATTVTLAVSLLLATMAFVIM
jgi:hypothetical protein